MSDVRSWFDLLRAAATREEAQTKIEYCVVVAVIAVGVILVFGALALAVDGKLDVISNLVTGGTGSASTE